MCDSMEPAPMEVELLTWSALLAQCVRFAQAAVALPGGEGAAGREGDAWRASVPHVIQLQAMWLALRRRDELPVGARALARDRAAMALERDGGALRRTWEQAEVPMPEGITALLDDVGALLAA